MNPADIAIWFRVGMDVAAFLARAIPKLIELFRSSDSDEEKALDALDLALEAIRLANDERLRAKHRAIPPPPMPSEFNEPPGGEEPDDGA